MSWLEFHKQSEILAGEAQCASYAGEVDRARHLYLQAAQWEEGALNVLDSSLPRSKAIIAVSAVACWHKAGKYNCARHLIDTLLADKDLLEDAKETLRDQRYVLELYPA